MAGNPLPASAALIQDRTFDRYLDSSELVVRLRKDPEAYLDDFLQQVRYFYARCDVFAGNPTEYDEELCNVLQFMSNTASIYPDHCADVPIRVEQLLTTYYSVMMPKMLRIMTRTLIALRRVACYPPERSLPLFFSLFRLKDKQLRRMLHAHLASDIRKTIKSTGAETVETRAAVQRFLFQTVSSGDEAAAAHALVVLVQLFKQRVWSDPHTANSIARGVFSPHPKISITSMKFLIGQLDTEGLEEAADASDSDDDDPLGVSGDASRAIQALKSKEKVSKKTKWRKNKLKTELRKLKRGSKSQQESRASTVWATAPIHLLHDPQGFVESLFGVLKRSKEKFPVKILMLTVISKIIASHKCVLLPFYSFLVRYMQPHFTSVTALLAIAAQAVHDEVPPEPLSELVTAIANNFVNDRVRADAITIGINAIREICLRQPLVMNETLLRDLTAYRKYKQDKGVVMASRSLIKLFRELCPGMLDKKDRGKFSDKDKKILEFGASKAVSDIPGIELLEQAELDEMSGSEDLLSEDDDISSEDDDEGQSSDGSDAPRLTAAALSSRRKRPRGESDGSSDDDDDEWGTASAEVESSHESCQEEGSDSGSEAPSLVPLEPCTDSDSSLDEEVEEEKPVATKRRKLSTTNEVESSAGTKSRSGRTASVGSRVSMAETRILDDDDLRRLRKLTASSVTQRKAGTSAAKAELLRQKSSAADNIRMVQTGAIEGVSEAALLHKSQQEKGAREEQRSIEKAEKRVSKIAVRKAEKGGGNASRTNFQKEHAKDSRLIAHSTRRRLKNKLGFGDARRLKELKRKRVIKWRIKRGLGA